VPDPTEPQPETPVATPVATSMAEPRQRWRLVVARPAGAPTETQRETADRWEAAFAAAALPLARTGDARSRARVSFGAPLPAGMAADGELIDIVLTERWPAWQLRERLVPVLPEGWRLSRLEDVWLSGPPLAGRVAGADYRIELEAAETESVAVDAARVQAACDMFLAARSVPRERRKGEGSVRYDLRPLVVDVGVAEAGPPIVIRARTRLDPERGSGRPEEVVAALGELIGAPLVAARAVRERLLLVDEVTGAPAPAGSAPERRGDRPTVRRSDRPTERRIDRPFD
jgi:radical SAM-linked protein